MKRYDCEKCIYYGVGGFLREIKNATVVELILRT